MRRASFNLSRIPRDPQAAQTVAAYLRKPPLAFATCLIVISLPLLLVGLILFAFMFPAAKTIPDMLGVILICFSWSTPPMLLGISLILRPSLERTARGVTDEDFDRQLNRDVYSLCQRALHKIQLNVPGFSDSAHRFADTVVSEPNLWCTGWASQKKRSQWGDFDDAIPVWKKGKDGQMRYRIYRVSILYLAEHHFAYYICDFNVETGLILWEETVDCHYKDIAAINFEEEQIRSVDVPLWWNTFSEALGILSISRLLLFFLNRLMMALAMQSDFNIRFLQVFLTNGTMQIATRITEQCSGFMDDSAVDPVVSKVRYLLQEKRMSYVRLKEPSAAY
jgi:hypothetical protein